MTKKRSNKMQEKQVKQKKMIIIISAIIITFIIGGIILQSINAGNSNTDTAGSNSDASGNWKSALSSTEKQIIYLGRPTCSWCNKIRPIYNYLVEKYDIKSTYINMDDISQSDQATIFDKLEIDTDSFGTPYIVVIEDGKKVTEQVGYIPEEQLFDFFKTNGLINEDETYKPSGITTEDETEEPTSDDNSAYVNINFIDYNGYKTVYENSDKSILVLGQTGCSYCNKYKPVLQEVAKAEGVKINYLDIRKLSEDEWNTLLEDLNDYFKDHEQWGTPLTLVLENKKVVDTLVGYTEKTDTLKFYKENGLIK